VHIAFFNRSFYPDTAATGQLLTDLCEDLVRLHGCRVSVVAGPPLLPSNESPAAGRGLVSREEYHGVEIYRARGTRFDKTRIAGRISNYVTYFLSACWAGLRLDKPDIVVALTDPPIIGLAAFAGRRFGAARDVYRDLFPGDGAPPHFHSDTINAILQGVNCSSSGGHCAGETMRCAADRNRRAAGTTVIIPIGPTPVPSPRALAKPFSEAPASSDSSS
jgi:hypothetical protein